MGLISCLRI